jgi:hypothetical protein
MSIAEEVLEPAELNAWQVKRPESAAAVDEIMSW